jgi:hypothetical protein
MASIRAARALAAVAAVPLALGVLGGVAHADSFAGSGGGQQAALGFDATNQNNNASVAGSAFTPITQYNQDNSITVFFNDLF